MSDPQVTIALLKDTLAKVQEAGDRLGHERSLWRALACQSIRALGGAMIMTAEEVGAWEVEAEAGAVNVSIKQDKDSISCIITDLTTEDSDEDQVEMEE